MLSRREKERERERGGRGRERERKRKKVTPPYFLYTHPFAACVISLKAILYNAFRFNHDSDHRSKIYVLILYRLLEIVIW